VGAAILACVFILKRKKPEPGLENLYKKS